jgi:phospholipid-transporting ATPase
MADHAKSDHTRDAHYQPSAPAQGSHPAFVETEQEKSNFRVICVRPPVAQSRGEKFCSNSINTSKYNLVTWLPVSLMMQFRRAANIYFLIISILSFMPFSPKNPLGMAGAFAAVLIMTMLKEGYEDYFRHRSDSEVNSRKVIVVTDNWSERQVEWRHVKVGDILKVMDNESFPADLLLMKSSVNTGLAFVNTMNLDGETNLKEKFAPDCTKDFELNSGFNPFTLHVDQPDNNLHKWNCNVEIQVKLNPVGPQQLLLRGCVLKNTDYVYGVVVYTGRDTKIVMNSKKPPQKSSNIMRMMNRILISVFIFEACLCFGFAAASTSWNSQNASDHEYLDLDSKVGGGFYFIKVLTYLVAYSHLIPISLYVTLEIVKLILARFVNADLNMYDEAADRPAMSRTSELIEELGEVEIIFSDKTGTLTANIMEFKLCYIGNEVYSTDKADDRFRHLYDESSLKNHEVMQFFSLMAVCNSVFPVKDRKDGKITYQATSPDELALVEASKKGGYEVIDRVTGRLDVLERAAGKLVGWEILVEIPFSSARGKMSVVVRDPKTRQVLVLSKGADSKLKAILKYGDYSTLDAKLDFFARLGLRTLVMASKTLDDAFFASWFERWNHILETNHKEKDANLARLAEEIEMDLNLVGASAIDDKLQDDVPETIKKLIEGNIRLWVLTGDKQETAIEIGRSCNLIQEGMELAILSSHSQSQFDELFTKLADVAADPSSPEIINYALVIDGPTLGFALAKDKEFFEVAKRCKSCICCRVSPINKSEVVALARKHSTWITLAIGDGANDVSMIQTAHVGVGIIGKEGTQAVQSSDYAISQFKYLRTLLYFHGRLGYKRVSWFICYYFYKNFTLVFTELGFAFMSGFSGQIYFLDLLPQLYNSLWTSWPCIYGFATDRDVKNKEDSMTYTWLYAAGQHGIYFNLKVFWQWVVMAIFHGLVCFLVPMYEFSFAAKDSDGLDAGLWLISTVSFNMVIHIVTLKMVLETTLWSVRSM